MEDKQLHTLRMLAQRFKRLGLSMTWLKAEAVAGRIPCFRAGRRVLFDPEAVERALIERAQRVKGSADDPGVGTPLETMESHRKRRG